MRRSMLRLMVCMLCLALACPAALASAVAVPQDTVPTPLPTPFVGTPSPEDYLGPTHMPFGWIQAGPVGFDGDDLTIEERSSLIHQLQVANLQESVKDFPVVAGQDSSRDKPIFIGQMARFLQQHTPLDAPQEAIVRINMMLESVVRGAEGAQLVTEMNAYNQPAPEGKEYVVATFQITIESEDPNIVVPFTMYEFEVVSANGKVLQYAFITDDLSTLSLYSGGNGTMRVTALVDEGQQVLLRYRKAVWFSTLTK